MQVSCLLEVLREGGATAGQRMLVHIENTEQKQSAVTRFTEQAYAAQLFRLGRERKLALKHLEAAQQVLDDLDPEITPRVELRFLHASNVLRLLKPDAKNQRHRQMFEQAGTFVRDYLARGYHCLRGLVEPA